MLLTRNRQHWLKGTVSAVKLYVALCFCLAWVAGHAQAQEPPPNNVTFFTDPTPAVTIIPRGDGSEVILHKELSAYGNYGAADGRADILYTGEVATWNFGLPQDVDPATVRSAFFRTSLIADDHYGVPLDQFFLSVWTNRNYLGNSPADLPHGSPFGTRFTNWVERDYATTTATPPYSVTLFNTSAIGGWYAIDWIELHLITGPPEPEAQLAGISPNRGGNTGDVTVALEGANFPEGPVAVTLRAAEQLDINGINSLVIDATKVLTSFDLKGAAAGKRDVVVTFSDGQALTLPAAFDVVSGGGGKLVMAIIGPSAARFMRETTYVAVVRNIGLNDIKLASVQLRVSEIAPSAQAITQLAPSTLNTTVGGLPPGGAGTFPFTEIFRECSKINAMAMEEPEESGDGCDALRKRLARLWDEFQTIQIRIQAIERLLVNGNCYGNEDSGNCPELFLKKRQLLEERARIRREIQEVERQLQQCEEGASSQELNSSVSIQGVSSGETTEAELTVCPVFSWDPNDKVGAAGSGPAKYVMGLDPIPYTIFFENKAAATAPAQEVTITDQLDANLDWSTVSLGAIKFGDRTVEVPEGTVDFTTTVDLRPEQNLLVHIEANLNPQTGLLTWHFRSLDPATGQPPTDPFAGFLPPNRNPPEGEGSLFYSVTPKKDVATDTVIRNQARIVFDVNDPIDTPEWSNTIDNDKPISRVLSLAPNQTSPTFNVQWEGTDVGSGLRDFTIYVSANGGPFTLWLNQTSSTQAVFHGVADHTYSFFSVARDLTDNVEDAKAVADATTRVPPNRSPVARGKNITVAAGSSCQAKISTNDIDDGSFDPDGDEVVLTLKPAGPFGLGQHTVMLIATDSHGASDSVSATVTVIDQTPPTIVNVSANPSIIWPPNRRMVDVLISYDTADNCAQIVSRLGVSSNELLQPSDVEILGAHHLRLRADRRGNGDGRTYNITIFVTDSYGNLSSKDVVVRVPHDQRK